MTKINIELKKKKKEAMERGENRARFIAIRLKINIFPHARVRSFKIPPFAGASNKQRTGKYFDEYISRANDSCEISFRIARRSALN